MSMTRCVIFYQSSPISLSRYTRLRGDQVRNALRDVHPVPDSARPKDEQCESNAPKARRRFTGLTPDPHFGEDAPHPQGDDLTVMNYPKQEHHDPDTVALSAVTTA